MVRAPTKAALSPFRTVDRAVVREDFPAFVTEAGVQGGWMAVGVRAVPRFEGGFFGEDSPEHTRGDSGVNESVSGGEKVIVVVMEAVFKGFGACGELLL